MLFLVVLFIVIPLAELYIIIQVGQAIGVLPTIAILLADALLGSLLLRHQGRAAWRRFNQALAEHRFPAREVADGVMITFGGALLLAPGFITDIAGLLLLIPPTRALVRRAGWGMFGRRFRLVAAPAGWTYQQARSRGSGAAGPDPAGSQGFDVEGTAEELGRNGPAQTLPDERRLPPRAE